MAEQAFSKIAPLLNAMAEDIHSNAKAKGWWDDNRSFPEIIALCHSELSEALEEYRNNRNPNETYYNGGDAKPEGIPTELADCIIRILDYCAFARIDIGKATADKHAYNQTRPHKHGGKVL